MSLCQCSERPHCELYRCGDSADWSVMVPVEWKAPLRFTPKFACNSCREYLNKVWSTPIKGIDRPVDAAEDWRPSLMDMMRHAEIAIAFEKRNQAAASNYSPLSRPGDAERYTPAQLEQIMILRRHLRAEAG